MTEQLNAIAAWFRGQVAHVQALLEQESAGRLAERALAANRAELMRLIDSVSIPPQSTQRPLLRDSE